MSLRHLALAAATLAAASLLSACSAGASADPKAATAPAAPPATAQRVTVKGLDTMRFDPPTVTVKAGQPVTLTFTNEGQIIHDWTLSQGVPQRVQIVAQGQQERQATFTVDRPGTYAYVCAQPGHEAAGMKGTLVAE
jgi:nitrite reductase (NO-forming)